MPARFAAVRSFQVKSPEESDLTAVRWYTSHRYSSTSSITRILACGVATRRPGVSSRAAWAGIWTEEAASGKAMTEVQRSAKDTFTTGTTGSAKLAVCAAGILVIADDIASTDVFATADDVISTGDALAATGVVSTGATAAKRG